MSRKAYLIYHSWEGEKNKHFIRMFQEEGEQQGISFIYVPCEEYQQWDSGDVVLNRTRLPQVSRWYEEKSCCVLHDSTVVEIANDKWKTLTYLLQSLEQQGISLNWKEKWLPDTIYLSGKREELYPCILWSEGREMLEYHTLDFFMENHSSLVIKTVSGHGGDEVWKVVSRQDIRDFLQHYPSVGVMMQEKISCASRDVRMYILGNQIYQGVLRQGRKDFRSNFSLGGQVSAYEPSEEQHGWMKQVLQGFGNHRLGMAGMDFLLGEDGRFYFNELEEMVGCRMLYQTTKKHIVRDYVTWIGQFMQSGKRDNS